MRIIKNHIERFYGLQKDIGRLSLMVRLSLRELWYDSLDSKEGLRSFHLFNLGWYQTEKRRVYRINILFLAINFFWYEKE